MHLQKKNNGVNIFPVAMLVRKLLVEISKPTIRSFDLMSMWKTSKLCQNVYHSTRLDGTRVVILLCDYSGPTGNFHKPYSGALIVDLRSNLREAQRLRLSLATICFYKSFVAIIVCLQHLKKPEACIFDEI